MDGSSFDLLTRSIAAVIPRRVALGRLAGGLLAAPGVALDATTILAKKRHKGKGKGKGKGKNKKCPNDRTRCDRACCKAHETCKRGKCVHHCKDGEKNFGETGIDCGGSCVETPGLSFGTCAVGQGCAVDNDCTSRVCVSKGAGKECVFCRIDSDCDRTSSSGIRCLDNNCFPCSADFDCPAGEFCFAAAICPGDQPCVCAECRVDTDCPEGQLCDEQGRCEGFECDSNQDCPPGRACEGGACTGTCVGPGGDVTEEGNCCSEVECIFGDRDICCDFGESCLGPDENGPCG